MKFIVACALAGLSAAVSVETEAEFNGVNDRTFNRLFNSGAVGTDTYSNLTTGAKSRTQKYLRGMQRDRASATKTRSSTYRTGFNNRFSNKGASVTTGVENYMGATTNIRYGLYSRNTVGLTADEVGSTSFVYGCHLTPDPHYNDFYAGIQTLLTDPDTGVPTDAAGTPGAWSEADNTQLTGEFGIECTTTFTVAAGTTNYSSTQACTYFAHAENFVWPRRALCTDATTCANEKLLQLRWYSPTGDDNTSANQADTEMQKLGAIQRTDTDTGKVTQSNDGSCRLPIYKTFASASDTVPTSSFMAHEVTGWAPYTASASTGFELGGDIAANVNDIAVVANPGNNVLAHSSLYTTVAGDLNRERYHDTHFLAISADEAGQATTTNNFGVALGTADTTVSPEVLEASYIQLVPDDTASVTITTYGTPANSLNFRALQPLACCQPERWSARSFQRYYAKYQTIRDNNCWTTASTNVDIIALPGWAQNTFLFKEPIVAAYTGSTLTTPSTASPWGICDFTLPASAVVPTTNLDTNLRIPGTAAD